MLHTQLLNIINSGDAWAFVGSGPSNDAGLPTWRSLVESALDTPGSEELAADPAFVSAMKSSNYPRCFSLLEARVGRATLEECVKNALKNSDLEPGPLHSLLADLPFAGYITTNYDLMLEKALGAFPGWVSVGNLGEEVRKVSRESSEIVWHVHGALEMSDERSRLVLTQRDYDDLYLEDSAVLRQMRSLLSQRYIAIIGFGFADPEVNRLLRSIGRMTDPTRPIFALLPKKGDVSTTTGRKVFLHENNIDVVPYKIRDASHRALKDLLGVYSALSLRRSLRYGQSRKSVPSYDPETTGLLIYNELVLSRGEEISTQVRHDLLHSRVLALLKTRSVLSVEEIAEEIRQLASAIGRRVVGARNTASIEDEIGDVLDELQAMGLATRTREAAWSLSSAGREKLADHAAAANLMEEQFRSSLLARGMAVAGVRRLAESLSRTAEGFLKDSIARRALGVAMAMTLRQPAQQDYHMVALLQALQTRLVELEDEAEGALLVQLIQDVLRNPSSAERMYIGVALQARFGLHLLGYDDDTLAARARDVATTAFIIDSSTLIPLLARSSRGHTAGVRLAEELRRCGATIVTTRMLVEEVSEHAQWALDRVAEGGGSFESLPVFEAATGRAGQRSNAFFGGYSVELAVGTATRTFEEYVAETCKLPPGATRCTPTNVERRLADLGIQTFTLRGMSGYGHLLQRRLEEYQAHLQLLRQSAETFTRDRQVEAEAEALVTVETIRGGEIHLANSTTSNACFISNTRIIDQVAGADIAVTMRPEAALQWLATLRPCSTEDLGALTSGLLWELQERGLDLVDKTMLLRAFSPFIDASEAKRAAESERLRKLLGQAYAGQGSLDRGVDPLDLPVVAESTYVQRTRELEAQLIAERARADAAEQAAMLSEKDREELDRLKSKARGRNRYLRMMSRRKREGK